MELIGLKEISILPELEAYLPPIDAIAEEKLLAELKAHGIREPLVVAEHEGKTIILDGHNRYRLAKKLKISQLPVVRHIIEDLTDARLFMVNNQLAKRNLSTKERVLIALQLEPELKAQAAERQKKGKKDLVQKSGQGRVIEQIAQLAGKSRDTISKIKLIMDKGIPELLAVADNQISINQAAEIAALSKAEQAAAIIEALKKPAVDLPDDRRHFVVGAAKVEDTKVIIDINTNLTSIDLTAETEAENIQLLRDRADYFASVANDLRQAAKLYKTPKEPKPKREKKEAPVKKTRKPKLTAAQKQAKRLAALLPDSLTPEERKSIIDSVAEMPPSKQIKAIKQAIDNHQP